MVIDIDRHGQFHLPADYLEAYRHRAVQWGFGPLSWVAYKRSYSRSGEQWWQTCKRVIEGTFTVQRVYCRENALPWDNEQARHDAESAYDRMWAFKWTPPGRGLWAMGTRHVYERGGAALNNCGFVSTKDIAGKLQVSSKTIDTHRQQIMAKLGVHSIAELTKYAISQGLSALDT